MEIDDNKKRVIERIDAIPTLPVIMMKILECIDDPHSSAKDLKNIIIKDISTSTKVLSLANSAYYGCVHTIEDITQAVVVLGSESVVDAALSVSLNSLLAPPAGSTLIISMEELWGHCIAAGEAARLYAKENLYPYKERAFLIGLTHDIGKIVMACFFPKEFNAAVEDARFNEKFIYDAEKSKFGFSHYEAGEWLAEKWNLPPAISVPIRFHHEPEKAPEEFQKEAVLAHFANYLVKFAGIGDSGDNNKLPELSSLVSSQLNVDEDEINFFARKLEKLRLKIEVFLGSMF